MSLLLAADFAMAETQELLSAFDGRLASFRPEGAFRLTLLESVTEPGRVLVFIWVADGRTAEPLVRSAALASWFEAAGVTDVPPVFAGRNPNRIELRASHAEDPSPRAVAGHVAVVGVVCVPDAEVLLRQIGDDAPRLAAAGGRGCWVVQAVDDPNEVLVVQVFPDQEHAQGWSAPWLGGVGSGLYPPLFVGTILRDISDAPAVESRR